MAELMCLLLEKKVETKSLLSWIMGTLREDEIPSEFLQHTKWKNVFVLYLLNFLREQSARVLSNSQNFGTLKNSAKMRTYVSPGKNSGNPDARQELLGGSSSCSKQGSKGVRTMRLFPAEDVRKSRGNENDLELAQRLDDSEGSLRGGRKGKCGLGWRSRSESGGANPNRQGSRLTSLPSLGDFITSDSRSVGSSRRRSQSLKMDLVKSVPTKADVLNISDPQVFPPVSAEMKKIPNLKAARRITPTLVSGRNQADAFGTLTRTSPPGGYFDVVEEDVGSMREKLRMQRAKNMAQPTTMPVVVVAPKKCNPEFVLTSPDLVSNREKLDVLVELYGSCIERNLVPNILVELYFLTQLLVVKIFEKDQSDLIDSQENSGSSSPLLLHTVHNCVYFTCHVLHRIRCLLSPLDPSHLLLLRGNARLGEFCPDLRHHLSCPSPRQKDLSQSKSLMIQATPFLSDTDSRTNFPSAPSFHAFCKQRDAFFHLVRLWRANSTSPGWSFAGSLGARVREVVALHPHPDNYMHFARLFIEQMVRMCAGEREGEAEVGGGEEEEEEENQVEDAMMLRDLRMLHPEKLRRLSERFVAPLKFGTPCPRPTFSGAQEFFHDFILAASCPAFNEHVKSCLVAQIAEANRSQFNVCEEESGGNEVDDNTRREFVSCLMKLRLMAKFLGFLTFLPYRSSEQLPENILISHMQLREKVPLAIDIMRLLEEAEREQRLVLLIPWLVEFLGQMDFVTPHLPCYQLGLLQLLQIYRGLSCGCWESERPISGTNSFFLKLLLGWLFELPNFPESVLVTSVERKDVFKFTEEEVSTSKCFPLDSFQIIDCNLLYACCPCLGELKSLLGEFGDNDVQTTMSVRHITPVSAGSPSPMNPKDQLQGQLEESFFHNQPTSVKKTVEFVSERVASNVVKHLRGKVVAESQQTALKQVKAVVMESILQSGNVKNKDAALKAVEEIAETLCFKCLVSCEAIIHTCCKEKAQKVIPLLLPEDFSEQARRMCCVIAGKESKEKALQWVKLHVTPSLFSKECLAEVERLLKNSAKMISSDLPQEPKPAVTLPTGGRKVKHDASAPVPSDTLQKLKQLLRSILDRSSPVMSDHVTSILQEISSVMRQRGDLIPLCEAVMGVLSVDLALSLIAHVPSVMGSDMQKSFISLWQNDLKLTSLPSAVLSPRNFMLLGQSSQPRSTWDSLESFLVRLLQSCLLTPNSLQDQCLCALRQEWPRKFLNHFASCLKGVVDSWCKRNASKVEDADFVQLIEWIVWFCVESEPPD